MNKKYLFFGIILGMIIISGCAKEDCPTACKDIPFSETAPEITQAELEEGWYYGQLDQKKQGTPDNWIYTLEGTRSAQWSAPSESTIDECDCNK